MGARRQHRRPAAVTHTVLASEVERQPEPDVILFAVTRALLGEVARDTEWSEPVRFRFERRGERWDLVMQKLERP